MEHARELERRRCNHHTLEEPLSEFACINSVVDPRGTKNNKHKLVVASQNDKLRTLLRTIPGVPLIYIKRSVMVMEPMAGATERVKDDDERSKFKAGLKGARGNGPLPTPSLKRKRDDELEPEVSRGGAPLDPGCDVEAQNLSKEKKRRKGPKGPNPLSVQKAKSRKPTSATHETKDQTTPISTASQDPNVKKKRKRRHKTGQAEAGEAVASATTIEGE